MESKKHRKINQENQQRRRFLGKQREKKYFWDEHEDFLWEFSSDESDFVEYSFDGYNSVEENLDEGDNRGGDSTQWKGLRDNDERVRLEMKEQIIQLVWNDDACEYLRGIRRCGSSSKEKRERHCKREMEKSASTTKSIVDVFSAQFNKNQSRDECVVSTSPPAIFLPKNTEKEVEETRFESQTRAVYDLSELLRLKTVQMNKYEHVLGY